MSPQVVRHRKFTYFGVKLEISFFKLKYSKTAFLFSTRRDLCKFHDDQNPEKFHRPKTTPLSLCHHTLMASKIYKFSHGFVTSLSNCHGTSSLVCNFCLLTTPALPYLIQPKSRHVFSSLNPESFTKFLYWFLNYNNVSRCI